MQQRFGKGRKGRLLMGWAGLESLEARRLLAAPEILDLAIVNPTVPVGKSLILPLAANDADGDALNWSFVSSSPNLIVQRHTGNPYLRLTVQNFGVMEFEMLRDLAPQTVDTILGLAQEGFYDGLIFHRVIPNFMIQGGDPLGTGTGGPGFQFDDEFHPSGIFTGRYQLAMANSGDDTNGSQFFITDAPTRHLDFNHTVFGQLVRGAPVVSAIAAAPRNASDKPLTNVVITKAEVVQNMPDEVVTLVASAAGSYTLTALVSDGTSTVQRNFTIQASADTTSSPSFFGPVTDQYTTANTPVSFTITGTNIQGTAPAYGAAVIGASPQGAATNVGSTVTVTPNNGFTGVLDVIVGVWQYNTQNSSVWDTQTIRVIVGDQPISGATRAIGALAGQSTTIRVATFTDADPAGTAGQYTAQINFGDGQLRAGTVTAQAGGFIVTGTNTYANPGSYPVKVTITGAAGARSIVNTTAIVTDPAAVGATAIEGSPVGYAGVLVNTSGATATVDLGLGGGPQPLPLTAQGGFTLNNVFTDDVTPTTATIFLTDAFGTHPAHYVRFAVQNAAPSATIDSVTPGLEGELTTINFTAIDPSSVDTAAGLSILIDWNDGSPVETVTGVTSATHTYATRGDYQISVRARDKDDALGAAATALSSVWPAGFEAQVRPVAALQGRDSTIRVATFTMTPASATYTAQIDWGDGQTSAGTVTPGFSGGFVVAGTHNYAAAGQRTVTVTISDELGLLGSIESTVNVVHSSGADVLVNEGSALVYAGSLPPDVTMASVNYGTAEVPLTLDAGNNFALDDVFADNGMHFARIMAVDEHSAFIANYVRIIAQNLAPAAVITDGSPEVMLGGWQFVSFTASDPSGTDQAAGLSLLVDWNDGTPAQIVPAANGAAWHQYAAPGNYMVLVSPVDKDGGTGAAQTGVLSVRAAEIIVDPGDAKKTALFIKGTEAGDVITVVPGTGAGGQAGVVYNGVGLGYFNFTGRILVHGNGGNDTVVVNAMIKTTAELHGGLGNDVLTGGSGADILVGDAGNDVMKGGNGRNILIGGLGIDKIYGGKNEDLLIAGRYKYEANSAMLAKALAGWIKSPSVNAKLFSKKTVLEDKASDLLTGSTGADAFFANTDTGVKDKIRDLRGEDLYEI